ncbi:MAG: S8 family serine peptidase [Polyangiales bacterium]
MNHVLKRSGYCLVASVFVLGCAERDEAPASVRERASVPTELMQVLTGSSEEVNVIVNFREPALAPSERTVYTRDTRHRLEARKVAGLTITHRYGSVPAVAGRISRAALERLQDDPDVESIEIDREGGGQLREAVAAIGADQVRNLYGLTGKGVRVAVLDTGLDTTHPDFGGAIVAQQCFTRGACPGFASTGSTANDDHNHGSNVAGVIGSRGVRAPRGFAPEVEFVSVKINNSQNSGYESDWVSGLDWVYNNLATLKVKVINASIGTTQLHANDGSCDRSHTAMVRAIRNLTEAGVTVFTSSGNQGSRTSLPSPSCVTGAIAVGAVYDGNVGTQPSGGRTYRQLSSAFPACSDAQTSLGVITCFTNSNARLDMVAPGAPILSSGMRGGTTTFWGTSQASPAAAGVAALMLQCNPSLTPAQIKAHLQQSGVQTRDAKNGLSFPSIRALAAVRAACPDLAEETASAP